jgi:PIN domain nuclease of toxin-antitoxin system
MILLDTHIWIWWVSNPERLNAEHRDILEHGDDRRFGVSIYSCWEVAKLVEHGDLELKLPVKEWLKAALERPGVELINLDCDIIVDSTQLPQPFQKDPADQLIVATARVLNCKLMTEDRKILAYEHVSTI